MMAGRKVTALLIAAGLTVSGCGGPKTASAPPPLQKLTVQFGFPLDGGTAPECLALIRNYYRDAGLDVQLRPGGPIGGSFLDATNALVADNSIDVAVDNVTTTLIIGKAKNANQYRAKVFADLWQEAPIGFLVRASSGLHSLKDLAGRRPDGKKWVIGATPDVPLLDALANYLGMKRSDLQVLTTGADPSALIAGQVDAHFGFDTNQGIALQQAGIPYRFLPLKEVPGLEQPAYVAEARESTLRTDSGKLAKWLQATQRGFADMARDPKAAAAAVRDRRCGGPQLDATHEQGLIERSLQYIQADGHFDKVGAINRQVVGEYAKVLSQTLQLPSVPTTDDMVDMSVLRATGQAS
jgi:NitT/TauT family transport system substrate-binding protein